MGKTIVLNLSDVKLNGDILDVGESFGVIYNISKEDSSNVRPMAITSPVAFICVPSLRLACTNLSNGQRGILLTI